MYIYIYIRVATRQEKVREKFFFQGRGNAGNFEICHGKTEFWKMSWKTDLCQGRIEFPGGHARIC